MSSTVLKLEEPAAAKRTSYGEILKSTALVGGSSALNIGIGIVRIKAMAMLLGPAGFGLMGLYSSIVDLAQSVASMGVAAAVYGRSPRQLDRMTRSGLHEQPLC